MANSPVPVTITWLPERVTAVTPGTSSISPAGITPTGRNRIRCSLPELVISAVGVSSATIRPRSRIATRSQSSSTSSIRWLTSTTVTPLSRTRRTRSQVCRRAAGSRPVVISSKNTSSGRPSRASARNSRCCWPPDSFLNAVFRLAASPHSSSSSSTGRGLR